MISYPRNWQDVGQPIQLESIKCSLQEILYELNCKNLAYSGGVDSTVMLSLMINVFGAKDIQCYNIALNKEHPDYIFSKIGVDYFNVSIKHLIPNRKLEKQNEDFPGDEIVREFYLWLSYEKIDKVIACDGIDEFMGGYYNHMKTPTEETYYDYMQKLQKEQLVPLHKNSGMMNVLLPYIDNKIILLLSQIPYSEKFDLNERKKLMNKLARSLDVPEEIINRHKYGFVDAMTIK